MSLRALAIAVMLPILAISVLQHDPRLISGAFDWIPVELSTPHVR